MTEADYERREAIAADLIYYDDPRSGSILAEEARRNRPVPQIPFPAALQPTVLNERPPGDGNLPVADVLVVTWTADEWLALSHVFCRMGTEGWHDYARDFAVYLPKLSPRSPAHYSKRLGAFRLVRVGDKRVCLFKSELHLSTDGPSLPLADLFRQIVREVGPQYVISTGTGGGLQPTCRLGDVFCNVQTRFDTRGAFAHLNGKAYRSAWKLPTKHLPNAEQYVRQLAGNLAVAEPPAPNWESPRSENHRPPRIYHGTDRDDVCVSTSFFQIGSTTNGMDRLGTVCDMDEAVLPMSLEDEAHQPLWASVRCASDPCANGSMAMAEQERCMVWCYRRYGYAAQLNAVLACWAIIAGV